jgi:hypothetical protein
MLILYVDHRHSQKISSSAGTLPAVTQEHIFEQQRAGLQQENK